MFMSSHISGTENKAAALRHESLQPEIISHALFLPKVLESERPEKPEKQLDGRAVQKVTTSKSYSSLESIAPTISDIPATELASLPYIGPRPMPPQDGADNYELLDRTEQAIDQSPMESERCKLATDTIHTYTSLASRYRADHSTSNPDWLDIAPEELLTRGSTNWPADNLLHGTEGLIMGMSLWCASMAYGAVHIAAWNDYFHTLLEQWLWCSSAIYISFSGALWLLINLVAHKWKALDAYWDRVLRRQAHWSKYVALGISCTICGVAYGLARLFMVAEALLSIRELPVAAYQSPDWTEFLPHL